MDKCFFCKKIKVCREEKVVGVNCCDECWNEICDEQERIDYDNLANDC